MFDRATVIASAAAAVDRLRGDPDTAAIAAVLADWLDSGATVSAMAAILPPAPRGGDHGRAGVVEASREMFSALRREFYPNLKKRRAAILIRNALVDYYDRRYEKAASIARIPPSGSREYWLHALISTGAAIHGGKVLDEKTIAAKFLDDQIPIHFPDE